MTSKALLVSAIDFGTTYSSWAFSFKHEFDSDPTKVSLKNWTSGGQISSKGPTSVLIKPDGKTVHKFGFDAESTYANLAADGKHGEWYFFRRFKMCLFNKELNRNDELQEEGGKMLPARTVFSLSIKYLKDDLLDMSRKQISGGLREDEILWVLTVPAIWNDAAKQMMREAAQEAGIEKDRLMIALEPEAASLLCRHLKVEHSGGKHTLASFGDGRRYIVLDAGGGTVDITVHEVVHGGYLKELQKASGGDWGGTKVDKEFLDFLAEIVGSGVMSEFKNDHMEDYLELLRGFEVKKREIHPDMDSDVTIWLPAALNGLVKKRKDQLVEDVVKTSRFASELKLIGDKLRIKPVIAKGFFDPSIKSVLNHVRSLLQDPRNQGVEAIVMVGGFSESLMLQKSVIVEFPNLKIIVPNEAGLAVLKGAVIFGHCPSMISERISKYTYGTGIINRKSIHRPLFSKLVSAGQTLKVGEAQDEESFYPEYDDQQAIDMDIYASLEADPKYINDPGCFRLGQFDVPVSGTGENREVKVKMIFGGTEIEVECKDVTSGEITRLKVNFLS